jgi:hypothetical protein
MKYAHLSYEEVMGIVSMIAPVVHDANAVLRKLNNEDDVTKWEDANDSDKASTFSALIKLVQDPDMSGEQLHNAWMAEKVASGWVYGKEKSYSLKMHPCMVPYSQLDSIQKAKDEMFRTIAIHMLDLFVPPVE